MRPARATEGSAWCCPVLGFLCCRRDPMGASLSQTQDGGVVASQLVAQPITMAEVVRERKRKMNGGLATLRRRLMAGRRGVRGPRSSDPAAPLRDLLREWSPIEVGALLEEYEALAALRDLCVQAELARPPAAALRQDLATLYDHRICPDAELIFKGSCFPVHRAILSARCPYFRELLNGYPSVGARVCLDSPLPPQVDAAALDGLLRYLYAGEPAPQPCDGESCDVPGRRRQNNSVPDCCPNLNISQHGRLTLDVVSANGTGARHARGPEPAMLRRLAQELGAQPAALHRDMRHLLDTAEFADASLVFTWEPPPNPPLASPPGDAGPPPRGFPTAAPPAAQSEQQQSSWDYGFRPRLELPCHRAVLSARSPFFRSVIQRRCRQQANETSSNVKIVLDERVIPHKYARVLLHAVYTDQVDLTLVMRGGGSIFGCSILGSHGSSLGEAQALAGNQQSAAACARSNSSNNVNTHAPSPLEEAMELYEIGRFLELDILSQGCEDIIAERLSASSLAAVLKWSSQPHGSRWVHRQALRYLREEFLVVGAGPALLQLEAAHLQHALRCPFLQASELDALKAALRWGEHRLVKRMEDREPNILSHTAHSVTRKGVKKRDLSDSELRELLADILPLVRTDHILPPNCELLTQAIRRGLVSSPPSCMLGDAPVSRADAWIRGKGQGGVYIRPRLYMPYYEEVKALLEDQLVQETELVRMRRARYIPDIPDTLYMVSAEPRARSSASVAAAESPRAPAAPLPPPAAPQPSPLLLRALLQREAELRRAPACTRATQRALTHTHEVNRQIRLRVVREFNLPDSVADTLEGATAEGGATTPQQHAARSSQDGDDTDQEMDEIGNRRCLQGSREGVEPWSASPVGGRRPLPSLLTEGDKARPHSVESVVTRQRRRQIQNGRGLSEAMPDVAMATNSLNRLRIQSDTSQKLLTDAQQTNAGSSGMQYAFKSQQSQQSMPNEQRASLNPNVYNSQFDQSCSTSYDQYGCDSRAAACSYAEPRYGGIGYHGGGNQPVDYHVSGNGVEYHGGNGMDGTGARLTERNLYGLGFNLKQAAGGGGVGAEAVPFMNPNQHLLQEGCGFGGIYGRQSRDRGHVWGGQGGGDPSSSYQHASELDGAPPLQLDLGDGNQHSSPARHMEATQAWARSHTQERGGTLPADYGQSQYPPLACQSSPVSRQCASYSRYLQDKGAQPPAAKAAPQVSASLAPLTAASNPMYGMNASGFSTLQHHGRSRSPRAPPGHASTLQRPRPICALSAKGPSNSHSNDTYGGNLAATFSNSGNNQTYGSSQCAAKAPSHNGSLSRSSSKMSCGVSNPSCNVALPGCHSLTKPKTACRANATSCSGANAMSCGVNATSCGVNVTSCGVNVTSCGGANVTSASCSGSVAGTPSSVGEREMGVHRSHSAGSVTSIGSVEIERRDVKSAVHNVSGFNHQPPSPRHFLYAPAEPAYPRASPRDYYLRMSPFQQLQQSQQSSQPSQGFFYPEAPLYGSLQPGYSRGGEYRLSENYSANLNQRSVSPGCRAFTSAKSSANTSSRLSQQSRHSPVPMYSQSSLKLHHRPSGDQQPQLAASKRENRKSCDSPIGSIGNTGTNCSQKSNRSLVCESPIGQKTNRNVLCESPGSTTNTTCSQKSNRSMVCESPIGQKSNRSLVCESPISIGTTNSSANCSQKSNRSSISCDGGPTSSQKSNRSLVCESPIGQKSNRSLVCESPIGQKSNRNLVCESPIGQKSNRSLVCESPIGQKSSRGLLCESPMSGSVSKTSRNVTNSPSVTDSVAAIMPVQKEYYKQYQSVGTPRYL